MGKIIEFNIVNTFFFLVFSVSNILAVSCVFTQEQNRYTGVTVAIIAPFPTAHVITGGSFQ